MRISRLIVGPACCLGILALGVSGVLSDDRVKLRSGGEIAGAVVAEVEADGDTLLTIRLASGGTMKLLRSQVQRIETTTPEELAYEERSATTPDTVEGHWTLANWCEAQGLREQREYHLLQVIKLDPNHDDARHDLGYSRIRGEWATRDQILRRDGKLQNGMLFEEYEIERRKDEFADRQTEFLRNLRVWRKGLGKTRHAEMLANIRAVNDPAAIRPVTDLLAKETSREAKQLWLEVLTQIDHPDIQDPLIQVALFDDDESIRSLALRTLTDRNDPSTQRYFMMYLDPDQYSPGLINRAGRALVEVGNSEAVRALIESVVTEHKVDNPAAGNPGGIGAEFGNQGGGGFKFGGSGPKKVNVQSNNEGVRAALQKITEVDYQFDKAAWLDWYVNQQTPSGAFDLRRND